MNYQIKLVGGQLVLDDKDQREHFEAQLRRASQIADVSKRLATTAAVVYPPIRKVADYMEWTQYFFQGETVVPGQHVRIAQDEYTAYAFFSSPDGEIMYTRPWRKYQTIDWRMVKCGLEFDWDLDEWGWDVASAKMLEAAEELARRRDELRQPLLNAAAISQAGHIPTSASTLTKASVDSIIQTSATNGFPVTQVAVNSGRLMDMTGWTLPANSMISGSVPEVVGRDILTKLYFNGYGGLTWITNHTIPNNYLYFSGPVSKVGWFFQKGGVRTASESDIDRDVDKHTWRQKMAAHVEGSHWVWRLEIT